MPACVPVCIHPCGLVFERDKAEEEEYKVGQIEKGDGF